MDNYSFEIKNKNVIQNNIDKIKRSMKKLKDTINRSNRSKSNNYQKIKVHHQNYHHKNKDIIKDNKSELYYNLNDYNLKNYNLNDFLLYNKNPNNVNVNLKNNIFHKSPSIYNNNIEINLIRKKIDKSFNNIKSSNYNFTLNNEMKNNYIYGSFFPSRNKFGDDNNKTETFLNNDLSNNNILTDFSSNIHQMNKSDYINNIQINRNKSQKQIKSVYSLINNNNYNDPNISKYSKYTKDFIIDDYSIPDITLNTIELKNNDNINNYEINLKNQIQLYDNINKGLLMRYKNIITNFKSANERNNLLINKINELKIKHINLKNTNKIIEDEFNNIQNIILEKKDNRELLFNKNRDLKNKIDKFDEIIVSLKNEINKLIEKDNNHINLKKTISDISDDNLQNKNEY